jgi:hypothetical protein
MRRMVGYLEKKSIIQDGNASHQPVTIGFMERITTIEPATGADIIQISGK